jgi:simple sugar transport system ATP-binding protein
VTEAIPPAVALRGIDKRFGAVQANRDVSLTVAKGTIHGLIGENGAGKSTLMSILYGFYTADAGTIAIHGKPTPIPDSHAAIRAGIAMVHQHFMLIDTLSVLDNVMLGVEGGAVLARHRRAARATLDQLSRTYGLAVDPDALVGHLPVGAQQRVEILKALYRGADIVILDEPTGVLTPREADDLFRVLDALRGQGKTVIIVTHKLREILAVTDRVSVMRGGEMVAERDTRATSAEELGGLMIGRSLAPPPPRRADPSGAVVLRVERLSVRDAAGVTRVHGIDLSVRAGEILGVAGVSGNGQSELLEALAGMLPAGGGAILLDGRDVTGLAPARLRALGVAHVPEDRQRTGLLPRFAARDSALLGRHEHAAYRRGPLLDWPAIERHAGALMRSYDVRPPLPRLRTALFSGGNQQKLVLAREAETSPRLLLVGQPTRGVDIGGIEAIHRRLLSLRDAGCAILLVSVELDEIRALSDRILVMSDGRIVGEATPRAAEERLGLLMAGIAA